MTKPYQLVVFDWEGTLGEDSLSAIISVLSTVAERLHLGSFDLLLARQVITHGLATAIKKLFPLTSMHQREELLRDTQKGMILEASDVRLMPGALNIVRWLYDEGVFLAIATNKGHQGLMRALKFSGLNEFFQVTRSASQVPAKPCPQMLEEIIDVFGVTREQTVMIGDTPTDMSMATSINVDAIGMDFFHSEAVDLYDAGALHVFNDYQQLQDLLRNGI